MRKQKKRIITWMTMAIFVIVAVIAAYGMITAPKKNTLSGKILEEELKQNQIYLQQVQNSRNTGDEMDNLYADQMQTTKGITVVGDSVALGAAQALCETLPNCNVDAEESRQVISTVEILKKLDDEGSLGQIVVLSLGTNGYFYESTGQEIIDYLGPERDIYWINVYGKYLQSHYTTNEVIANLASKNSNVTLIDWNTEGEKYPDWFYEDGIHLNETGQLGFAEFILKNLNL